MLSIPQVSSRFGDIKPLMDAALASGGGIYHAPTSGQAVRFRQRAYQFRKAFREAAAPAASPYDRLTIKRLAPGDTKVEIVPISLPGTFTPAEGPPVIETAAPVLEDDELLQAAEALKFKLDL